MTKNNDDRIPIACSLSATDQAEREVAWRGLLRTSLLARERIPGGLRLTVRADAGPQLMALVDLERSCCPWITFAVDGASVAMTAEGDAEEALGQMFRVI